MRGRTGCGKQIGKGGKAKKPFGEKEDVVLTLCAVALCSRLRAERAVVVHASNKVVDDELAPFPLVQLLEIA